MTKKDLTLLCLQKYIYKLPSLKISFGKDELNTSFFYEETNDLMNIKDKIDKSKDWDKIKR